jgi:hypothetical protein
MVGPLYALLFAAPSLLCCRGVGTVTFFCVDVVGVEKRLPRYYSAPTAMSIQLSKSLREGKFGRSL